jgi:hypothetical protein
MSDELEQGELTGRFQAFQQSVDPAPSRALPAGLIAFGVLVVLGLIAAVWILLSR